MRRVGSTLRCRFNSCYSPLPHQPDLRSWSLRSWFLRSWTWFRSLLRVVPQKSTLYKLYKQESVWAEAADEAELCWRDVCSTERREADGSQLKSSFSETRSFSVEGPLLTPSSVFRILICSRIEGCRSLPSARVTSILWLCVPGAAGTSWHVTATGPSRTLQDPPGPLTPSGWTHANRWNNSSFFLKVSQSGAVRRRFSLLKLTLKCTLQKAQAAPAGVYSLSPLCATRPPA